MKARLTRIHIEGFRSFKSVDLELGPITVLIGPNGAGKTNLLDALTMASMMASKSLQLFVGRRGGASSLMHYGPRKTPVIELSLEFETEIGQSAYEAKLGFGADESLLFLDERAALRGASQEPWTWHSMGAGHRESRLEEESIHHATARIVRGLMQRLNFYHFHDTSVDSPLRTLSKRGDDQYLRSDGSNLAAFLLRLRQAEDEGMQASWNRIQGLVQQVAPFIRELQPVLYDPRTVRLDWVDDQGEVFSPHHMSDGTLRAIALFTALGQPGAIQPMVSCIDEPELGLHPAALSILCGLIRSVAARRQVIVSTQSPAVLDQFGTTDVVVAERKDGATHLRRLEHAELDVWLEEYSLSELYDKNVLGGRP